MGVHSGLLVLVSECLREQLYTIVAINVRWYMIKLVGREHQHVSGFMGVSLNGGTPKTPQNDHL